MKLQLESVADLVELRETYQRGVFSAIRVSKNLSTVSIKLARISRATVSYFLHLNFLLESKCIREGQ
jgi:hypothetical protein